MRLNNKHMIVLTNEVRTINGDQYTITCDATKDGVTKQISVTMTDAYPSDTMMFTKAYSAFLPQGYELPA